MTMYLLSCGAGSSSKPEQAQWSHVVISRFVNHIHERTWLALAIIRVSAFMAIKPKLILARKERRDLLRRGSRNKEGSHILTTPVIFLQKGGECYIWAAQS